MSYATYSTTRPRHSDTKAIAKAKWLQLLREGASGGSEGGLIIFPNTEVRHGDSKLTVLQKILQKENG